MTATEELRRLLDERGVEWHDTKIGKGFITVFEHDGITWIATEHSSGRLSIKGCVKPTQGHYDGMTPEQAVAATLGPMTCILPETRVDHGSIEYNGMTEWRKCNACREEVLAYPAHFCPNCGAKVVE